MHARRARETMGNNGLGNFRAGDYHWDTLGRQLEAMALLTFGLGITFRTGSGGKDFGNFWAGDYHWDMLGRQWDAMDVEITLRVRITLLILLRSR